MVGKDTNKPTFLPKAKPASVNFLKTRQLFESFSLKSTEDSVEHPLSSRSVTSALADKHLNLNRKKISDNQKPSVLNIFVPDPVLSTPNSSINPLSNSTSSYRLPSNDSKPSSSSPPIPTTPVSSGRPTSLVLTQMPSTPDRPSRYSISSIPSPSLQLSLDTLDSSNHSYNLLDASSQSSSFHDSCQLAESISFSLSLKESIRSDSNQYTPIISDSSPSRSTSLIPLNSQSSDFSKPPSGTKSFPRENWGGSSSTVDDKGRFDSPFSRISCLNPKDLEPSLTSVLDVLDFDYSSVQSSSRQSTDFSIYPATNCTDSDQRNYSTKAYSSVKTLGGLVFDQLSNHQPSSSDSGSLLSPELDSPQSSAPTQTSSHNCDFLQKSIPKLRPDSTASYISPDPIPSLPPKSHLRSLHLQSKKKSGFRGVNPPPSITHVNQKNRSVIRKLSDPELFAKGETIGDHVHVRSASNRTYNRDDKSLISTILAPIKTSSTPTSVIPTRLQSLDNLSIATSDKKSQSKSKHIIDEIINSESSYLMDLVLLKEIYLDGASARDDLFSPRDLKLIFINVEEIISFSEVFLAELQLRNTITSPAMGKVFIDKHEELQSVYSQYFKMHEASIIHLQDMLSNHPTLTSFLECCNIQLKEHSKSWDIHSLLIKPIQRVLKYPLLLMELLSATHRSDPDYKDLMTASQLMQGTADYYNELKRRKDAIDRIIGPKNKKQEHHIRAELNKKLFRGAQHLRKMAGIKSKSVDPEYDTLAQRFYIQETLLRRFWDEVQMWTLAVEESYNIKDRQARAFLALYAPPGSGTGASGNISHHHHHLFSAEYCKLTSNLAREMVSFLNHEVYTVLFEKINQLIRLFNTPALLMKKRDRKLLDYDSLTEKEVSSFANEIKSNVLQAQKNKGSLAESAQAYQLINKELVNELPSFLGLAQDMFTLLVSRFTWIQQEVYGRAAQQLARLLVAFERPHSLDDNIVRLFNNHSLEEGILDPFIKVSHALLATSDPRATLIARMGRSLSSETVVNKHYLQATTICSRSDSTQSARLTRTPTTHLSPRRVSLYPGIPPQFYNTSHETLNLDSQSKSEAATESSELLDEADDDNTSVAALDGSFMISQDSSMRRDHLLADVNPSLFDFSSNKYPNGLNSKNLLVPNPSFDSGLDDNSPIFSSLREDRTSTVKSSLPTHSKSSSTPENTILRDLEKELNQNFFVDNEKPNISKTTQESTNSLMLKISRIYFPQDQESVLSSALERDYHSSISLSRQCSKNSIKDGFPLLSPLVEMLSDGSVKPSGPVLNGNSESLTSGSNSALNHRISDSGSLLPQRLSESRTDMPINNSLNSANGSIKYSPKTSKEGGRSKHKSRPVIFECKAVFPYSAASDTELSLIPGMELHVFKCSTTNSCPWWYGEDAETNNRGWFPSSFCKKSPDAH